MDGFGRHLPHGQQIIHLFISFSIARVSESDLASQVFEATNAPLRQILKPCLSFIREGDGEHPTPSGVPKVVYPHVGLIAGEMFVGV